MSKVICGEANKGGNIMLTYKGGCRKKINIKDAYRCVGCGGWFCRECLIKHFKLEKDHDWGREEERKHIAEVAMNAMNFVTDNKLSTERKDKFKWMIKKLINNNE